ncbi:hypothetical protein [Bacillus sp. JCM 19041]|uniref:hypothetical protein n=1 Tax=Bacillus sp. JCM 19041 TaxID=1460637 RepID=UPI0006CF8E91
MKQHHANSEEAINGLPEAQADLIGLYATKEQNEQFHKQRRALEDARWKLTEEDEVPEDPENPRPEPIEEDWEPVDGEQLVAEVKTTLGQIRELINELNPEKQPEEEDDNGGGEENPPGEEPVELQEKRQALKKVKVHFLKMEKGIQVMETKVNQN